MNIFHNWDWPEFSELNRLVTDKYVNMLVSIKLQLVLSFISKRNSTSVDERQSETVLFRERERLCLDAFYGRIRVLRNFWRWCEI